MKLGDILGKTLLVDGQSTGIVDAICWQKGQCFLIKIGNKTFGADKIKIKKEVLACNLQAREALPLLNIDKQVFDTDGKFLGKVADVELTKTLKVKSLILDNDKIISASKVVGSNDIVTVRSNKPKTAKKKPVVMVNTPQQVDVDTEILKNDCEKTNATKSMSKQIASEQVGPEIQATTEITTAEQITPFAPRRRSGDFSFLVGKVVDKNIFNFLGELMIKEGEIVTREVYLKARYFGKLTELCLHTK